jgi:hypothetical protein
MKVYMGRRGTVAHTPGTWLEVSCYLRATVHVLEKRKVFCPCWIPHLR